MDSVTSVVEWQITKLVGCHLLFRSKTDCVTLGDAFQRNGGVADTVGVAGVAGVEGVAGVALRIYHCFISMV